MSVAPPALSNVSSAADNAWCAGVSVTGSKPPFSTSGDGATALELRAGAEYRLDANFFCIA